MNTRGFTLLELLVSLLVLGVLGALTYPIVLHQINKAKEVEAITVLRNSLINASELNSQGVPAETLADLITITKPLRYYNYTYKRNFLAFKGKQGSTYAVVATPLESGLRTFIAINLLNPLNGADSAQIICRSQYPNADTLYLLVGININEFKCDSLPGEWVNVN